MLINMVVISNLYFRDKTLWHRFQILSGCHSIIIFECFIKVTVVTVTKKYRDFLK